MTKKDSKKIKKGTVNKAELASAQGVSLPTVDAWIRKGCPFKSKGGPGQEWEFDLNDVEEWRDLQVSLRAGNDSTPLPAGCCGNALRDLIQMATESFFFSLENELEYGYKKMYLEMAGVKDPEKALRLFAACFFTMASFLQDWIEKDVFSESLKEKTGETLDGWWNLICHESFRVSKRTKSNPLKIEIPVTISAYAKQKNSHRFKCGHGKGKNRL